MEGITGGERRVLVEFMAMEIKKNQEREIPSVVVVVSEEFPGIFNEAMGLPLDREYNHAITLK